MNRVQNMLLGIAVGDAFGAGYEFAFPVLSKYSNNLDKTQFKAHPLASFKHEKGRYTDDTQMSIGVCEALLSDNTFSTQLLADKFVSCYKRDPVIGYAKGFQNFLDSISTGDEFLKKIRPRSNRNGAMMRSVPFGLLPKLEDVLKYAKINASVTHDTPFGISSSISVALMSHYQFYRQRLPDIKNEVLPHIGEIDPETTSYLQTVLAMNEFNPNLLFGEEDKNKGVPCDAQKTLGAVCYILTHYFNSEDVLFESIKLGGDTDSVASIALGIHMINDSVQSLPSFLLDGLVNTSFGKDYLVQLGEQLHEKYFLK